MARVMRADKSASHKTPSNLQGCFRPASARAASPRIHHDCPDERVALCSDAAWLFEAVAVLEANMAVTLPDETRLRALLTEALVEALEQRREWLAALMAEALEDIAFAQAIREGETSEVVSRDEIFALLSDKR